MKNFNSRRTYNKRWEIVHDLETTASYTRSAIAEALSESDLQDRCNALQAIVEAQTGIVEIQATFLRSLQ